MSPRQLLHRYVPAHFHDPVGLASRLIRSGDQAAWFAMGSAALGAALTPLDLLLQLRERRLLADDAAADAASDVDVHATSLNSARAPRPLILICGPPRSGTTVVCQSLVNHLPVGYFSNLTSLFPRSPLSAMQLFGRLVRTGPSGYDSYYGHTRGLGGVNDALYLWDRWLGPDRDRPAVLLTPPQQREMQRFFAACDRRFGQAIVNKNNNLIASAHLVAECLPQARFVCLQRDPHALARSLYRARKDIHGAADVAYGLAGTSETTVATNPVLSVCEQVRYYQRLTQQQQERIGPDRFWTVAYEDFCRDPAALLRRVATKILGDPALVHGQVPTSFPQSDLSKKKVEDAVAAEIDASLKESSL